MTKIVHISHLPATTYFIKSHFINELLQQGVNVEYWDISRLFYADVPLPDKVDAGFIVEISDKRDLKNRLYREEESNTIFVIWFHCRWGTLWAYRLLFKGKFCTAFIDIGSIPMPRREDSVFIRLTELMMRGQIKRIAKAILYRVGYYLYGLRNKSYGTVFAAGLEAVRRHEGRSHVVKINHRDYDDFLALSNSVNYQLKKNYVVFIDQYQGLHLDPILLGRRSVNPENYQRGLNKFFDLIEKRFNIDVVIAAHPKSDYQNGVFNNREIIKYKTNELVKDCEFVLGHGSTALSFAILYRKPIMLIYNNELKNLGDSSIYPFIETFSSVLGAAPVYNVDEVCVEEITRPSVDLEKYLQYKYEYLTSPQTEGKLTGDILFDFLCG